MGVNPERKSLARVYSEVHNSDYDGEDLRYDGNSERGDPSKRVILMRIDFAKIDGLKI